MKWKAKCPGERGAFTALVCRLTPRMRSFAFVARALPWCSARADDVVGDGGAAVVSVVVAVITVVVAVAVVGAASFVAFPLLTTR